MHPPHDATHHGHHPPHSHDAPHAPHSSQGYHHHETNVQRLWVATGLTAGYAAVEAGVSAWAGSLALMADAGHMLNDAAALALAAIAAWLAQRPASARHSYGLGRAEFLAAFINSVALLILVAWIAVSAVQRLYTPQPVHGEAVSIVALIGLAINVVVARLLSHSHANLNTRAALLHVLGDLLGSVAALVSGMVIAITDWMPIDPLLSLGMSALILGSSLKLLREAVRGLMEGAPPQLVPEEVGQALATVPGVASVHDLHIWSVTSGQAILTAHLVVHDIRQWEGVLDRCHALMVERFNIHHTTLQPEPQTRTIRWVDRPPSANPTPVG